MAKLDHPNIVKLIDYFEEGNMYYIVTELADGIYIYIIICLFRR